MPFSDLEILEEYYEATALRGITQSDLYAEQYEVMRRRMLDSSLRRWERWYANPSNREKKRLWDRAYEKSPDGRAKRNGYRRKYRANNPELRDRLNAQQRALRMKKKLEKEGVPQKI